MKYSREQFLAIENNKQTRIYGTAHSVNNRGSYHGYLRKIQDFQCDLHRLKNYGIIAVMLSIQIDTIKRTKMIINTT